MTDPTNDKVRAELIQRGLRIDNLKGVPGTFYTKNRRDDLMTAIGEVLHEKYSAFEDGEPYRKGAAVALNKSVNDVTKEERGQFKLAFHETFARIGPDLVRNWLQDLNRISHYPEVQARLAQETKKEGK